MPRIFVTRIIPDEGIKLLESKGFEVDVYPHDEIISRRELLARVRGVDAILSILTDKIDEGVFKAAGPQLKIVANYAVGFDNIDLAAAAKRNIFVTNAPGPEIAEAVAEHTIALMLGLSRRIAESDRFTRQGKYTGWGPQMMLGSALKGKTLGIVGLGRIGYVAAEHAVMGFGMNVVYFDHKTHEDFEKQYGAKNMPLKKLLATSDFVSLHVPLTPETKYLMNRDTLSLMKKTAFLINTARGPVIEEKALLEALRDGLIGGAALDVFECEPSIDCDLRDHVALKSFENVILTPHTASATIEARQAMSRVAAENIIAALTGKKPPNLAV